MTRMSSTICRRCACAPSNLWMRVPALILIRCAAMHCNILQHATTPCSTLQHTATRRRVPSRIFGSVYCSTLQRIAGLCNTSLQRIAGLCNTSLQRIAGLCNTSLQRIAGLCNASTRRWGHQVWTRQRKTLQHTAWHCRTLHPTATNRCTATENEWDITRSRAHFSRVKRSWASVKSEWDRLKSEWACERALV